MPGYTEETRNVSIHLPGRWVWNNEEKTVAFVSSCPAEEGFSKERTKTNVSFRELQLRSEWLADICKLNNRGRHSTRKSLSHAHLTAYRSSMIKRQGDFVTIDDVKQVAISLLQENYTLPIPSCFLALLTRKELDEVLTALLLYLCCFFEHKSLESKADHLVVDIITERQQQAKALAKKETAQKNLAVSYFSLIMDSEVDRRQRISYREGRSSSNSTEWLLHACLYSFFCYVAWVTFSRQYLKDIQEEVGRLFYSDAFNVAVRNRADGDLEMTSSNVDGSMKTAEADPKETGYNQKFRHRSFQKRPSLSSIVNQRSPLMVSLLPSPKELSPHLFLSSRARNQSPLPAGYCDSNDLTEEIHQQLADVSFGILGKPMCQFSRSTLIPLGENQNNSDEEEDREPDSNSKTREDQPGFSVRGSRSSHTGPCRSTCLTMHDITT